MPSLDSLLECLQIAEAALARRGAPRKRYEEARRFLRPLNPDNMPTKGATAALQPILAFTLLHPHAGSVTAEDLRQLQAQVAELRQLIELRFGL